MQVEQLTSVEEEAFTEVLKTMRIPGLRNLPTTSSRASAVKFVRVTGDQATAHKHHRPYVVLQLSKAGDNAFYPVFLHAAGWNEGRPDPKIDWFTLAVDSVEDLAQMSIKMLRLLISIMNGKLIPLGFRINACELVTHRVTPTRDGVTEFESKTVKFDIRQEPWEFGSQEIDVIGIYEMNQQHFPGIK